MVVPGLLACLALRFDASRASDMRARAAAAAEALQRAVGALGVLPRSTLLDVENSGKH